MNRLISTILIALLSLPSLAQGWDWQHDIDSFDPAHWLSETVVHASVVVNGVPQGDVLLAAFVDGQLRGYADGATHVDDNPGLLLYTVRVKGDEKDRGQVIEWRIVNKATGVVYLGDDIELSRSVVWTGETEGMPSQPIIISIGEVVPVSAITTVEGRTLVRQDYNYVNPYDLSDCYEVLPADALHREVTMRVRDYTQGSVYQENDAWKFVPSGSCQGEVIIDITSVSNPTVMAELRLTVKVRVESIRIYDSDQIILSKGEKLDIYNRFSVIPYDADNQEVDFEYDPSVISVSVIGEDVIVEGLEKGTTDLVIRSKENPEISGQMKVFVASVDGGFTYTLLPCDDDITDADKNIITLRQAIWTRREIVFSTQSEPSVLVADYVGCEVTCDQTLPDGWQANDVCEAVQDDGRAVLRFIPRVPGRFTLHPTYNGQPMKDADGNVIEIFLDVCLSTELNAGWSWYSAGVAEDGTLLSQALSDSNVLIEARTQRHYLFNDPELGYVAGFRNEEGDYIDDMTLDQQHDNGHYRIKLTDAATIYTDGQYNLTASEWQINKGWTWVCNPSIYHCLIEQFEGLGRFDEGDVLKTKTGMASFSEGRWWGSITEIAPGEGIAIYKRSAGAMTFDMADFSQYTAYGSAVSAPAHSKQTWQYDASRFMDNMGIIAVVDADYDFDFDNYTIGAFVGDECRGEGMLVDGRWYIVVHGEGDEEVTLRLRNTMTGEETTLAGRHTFTPILGTHTNPIHLTIQDERTQDNTPTYTLQGIRQPLTSTLSSGVYIHAGKKLITQ